jgi:hypothetical protein
MVPSRLTISPRTDMLRQKYSSPTYLVSILHGITKRMPSSLNSPAGVRVFSIFIRSAQFTKSQRMKSWTASNGFKIDMMYSSSGSGTFWGVMPSILVLDSVFFR